MSALQQQPVHEANGDSVCAHHLLLIGTHPDFISGYICHDCGSRLLNPNLDGYAVVIAALRVDGAE